MNIKEKKRKVCVMGILGAVLFMAGCGPAKTEEPFQRLTLETNLGSTKGSLVEVFASDIIIAEGYALVGGLRGTGSTQCDPAIGEYLKKYILKQLPGQQGVKEFINRPSTAVVFVRGVLPAMVSINQRFDIQVIALPGTQTTSLEDGYLLGVDLYEKGRLGMTAKILATAEGPVFINKIAEDAAEINKMTGYVLGGGIAHVEYKVRLVPRVPDYQVASQIRNRLNERFEDDTAEAISPGQIELRVPAEYRGQKERFVSITKAMYLYHNPQVTQERIIALAAKLAIEQEKYEAEIGLEAIGNESIGKLAALLNSSDEQVRLQAARSMLQLGDNRALKPLREIAMDKNSAYRIEALEAIAGAASRNNIAVISRKLLRDDDFRIRLAAHEKLRKLDDIAVAQKLIAGDFYLEQIARTQHKGIFVSRSGQPRIVLFGAPIYCKDNIFIQSDDGKIIINAPVGQGYVNLIRKHPTRPNIPPIQLKSSFELNNIIQTLCASAVVEPASKSQPGLGVSYSDAISILEKMCDRGAVEAEFLAGPLPKIDAIIKK